VLAAWKGQEANVAAAQKAHAVRCQLNGMAHVGKYSRSMEPGK
jgi:fructose-bisphosphate aldolase class I